jgi:hypothetical protein
MTKPYIPHKAGDFITAKDWNDMQTRARTEIQKHNHTGGQQGTQISGKAIKSDSEVTLKNLTVENGYIMGFSPLFQESEKSQDKRAVAALKDKDPGTFLIGGPCKENDRAFRIYWKATEEKYRRFDITSIGITEIPAKLDSSGDEIKD